MRPINVTETRLTLAALVCVFAFAAWDARADGPQPGTSDPQVCPAHIVPNPCKPGRRWYEDEDESDEDYDPAPDPQPEPEPEPEEPTEPEQEEPDHDEEPDGEPDHDEPEHDEEPDREDGEGY